MDFSYLWMVVVQIVQCTLYTAKLNTLKVMDITQQTEKNRC